MIYIIVLLLLSSLISRAVTLNILVWSTTIGHSHVKFMGHIADTLREDGHNITLLMIRNDPDVIITGTKLVEHILWYSSPYVERDEWYNLKFKQGNIFSSVMSMELSDLIHLASINYRICRGLLDDPSLITSLQVANFDLAVIEMFHFCPAGIIEMANIPKILLASALGIGHHHYQILGLEARDSYIPAMFTPNGSRMTFVGRIYNVIFKFVCLVFQYVVYYFEHALFTQKLGSFPNLSYLYKDKTDYILLNTNEFTESTRPFLPSIQHIGGVTTNSPMKLSDDFDSILAKGKKGAILFSLGSIVKSGEMPTHLRQAFLDSFRCFPDYQIIWKDDMQRNFSSPNVHYRSWVPQVDLLADPRVKLFITHGGMNSIQESLLFGVPMVTMPIFGDQDSNAIIAEERGVSYTLNKFSITKEKIIMAISSVLGSNGLESSYTKQAKQASRLLKGSPEIMKQKIKKLARISGSEPPLSHIRLNIDHLNIIQYFNIDVYVVLLITLTILILSVRGFCSILGKLLQFESANLDKKER